MSGRVIRLAKPIVDKFPALALAYRHLRDSRLLKVAPHDTVNGFKFSGSAAMRDGVFEPIETALLRSNIPNVDILINVGANIGYYCCIAAQLQKHVVAFVRVAGLNSDAGARAHPSAGKKSKWVSSRLPIASSTACC